MAEQPSPDNDKLLRLLDEDLDKANAAYTKLRKKLMFYFRQNGSRDAGNAADEVICRVVRRVAEGIEIHPNVNAFCYGVANLVLMEERGKTKRQHFSIEDTGEPAPETSRGLTKLENSIFVREGLAAIPAEDRRIWLEYHQDDRVALAQRLHLTPNAMRIKISRIRSKLREILDDPPEEL
jgi:DNA-directed RNA polymerase specialized sigma24 family protein